jgi:hypothetical protein
VQTTALSGLDNSFDEVRVSAENGHIEEDIDELDKLSEDECAQLLDDTAAV